MSEIIKNRSEILFLYDVKDNNPNGDPLDGNKPRIDEETNINIVTDVRLKRTIRDYLMNFKNQEIFVKEIIYDEEEHIQDAKLRAKDFIKATEKEENKHKIISKFLNKEKIEKKDVETIRNNILHNLIIEAIDIRLFGATVPLEFNSNEIEKLNKDKKIKTSITLTGPVQFRMGRSLHKVELKYIKGTGAFASKEGATQKTFREEYILPYSLIAFYGIINENAAKHTNLNDDDIELLLEGIWNGTKNLISRSKAGQEPRLLLKINYKENNYHIGDLDKLIKIDTDKRDEELRDIGEIKLNTDELEKTLIDLKDTIESIEIKIESRLTSNLEENLSKNFKLKKINWLPNNGK